MPLVVLDDLESAMRQTFPGDQEQTALDALADAESIVLTYLRRPDLSGIPAYAHRSIKRVMLRRAASIFRYAVDRTSYSAEGISMTVDPRILTGDERDLLRQYRRMRRTTGEPAGGPGWPETFGFWENYFPVLELPLSVTHPDG